MSKCISLNQKRDNNLYKRIKNQKLEMQRKQKRDNNDYEHDKQELNILEVDTHKGRIKD